MPKGLSEELQDWCRCFDEGGGDIARGLVTCAGAALVFGMRRSVLGGSKMLLGTAGSDFRPLRSHSAAPAHREADAESEKQRCEAGEHVYRVGRITLTFIPEFQRKVCAGIAVGAVK